MVAPVNSYRVAATNGEITVSGDSRQRVFVGLNAFFKKLPRVPSPRAVDLLLIGAGTYAIDRMVTRRRRGRAQDGIRTFDISFAVQEPLFWSQPNIKEMVVDALSFLTDDNWSVSFELSVENGYQPVLPIPWFDPTRVALFSEGLDSAAGLADQAAAGADRIMLVTVGHYPALRRRSERQILDLQQQWPRASLYPASILVSLRGGVASRLRLQEKTQRSRAFLFCAAGIAAALACEVSDIDLYESGVGAINLPLMTGMLFGGLSSRGAHPTFLAKMSALGASLADQPIAFSLPYSDLTKGEVLGKLRDSRIAQWLQRSRSCVHTSLRTPDVTHCGVCPACIERRQAFAVAMIEEDTSPYMLDVFRDSLRLDECDYLALLVEESAALLEGDPKALRRLKAHMVTTEVDLGEFDRVLKLLHRHAEEICQIFPRTRTDYGVEGIPGDNALSRASVGVAS
jgi:hypothetical protein